MLWLMGFVPSDTSTVFCHSLCPLGMDVYKEEEQKKWSVGVSAAFVIEANR